MWFLGTRILHFHDLPGQGFAPSHQNTLNSVYPKFLLFASPWKSQGISLLERGGVGEGEGCPHRIIQTLKELDIFVQRVHFGLELHLDHVGCICILPRGTQSHWSILPTSHQVPCPCPQSQLTSYFLPTNGSRLVNKNPQYCLSLLCIFGDK